MNKVKTILVVGATGAMGRYVVNALTDWNVKALTRNSQSKVAQSLLSGRNNIELVTGNTSNLEEINSLLIGVDAVFINTDFWTNIEDPENERQQMLNLLDAAKTQNVKQVIFSSLENCMSGSDGSIPVTHFDSKAIVEQEINWQRSLEHFKKEKGFYSQNVVVLRTLPYFENLMSFFTPTKVERENEVEFIFTLPIGEQPFAMVALSDIAWFTKYSLDNWTNVGGKTLKIGSEALTGKQIAEQFSAETGLKSSYHPVSDEEFLSSGGFAHDALNHFLYHRKVGMPRDYNLLRSINPDLRTFRTWLKETGWRGESRLVQKKLAE